MEVFKMTIEDLELFEQLGFEAVDVLKAEKEVEDENKQ